MAPQIPPLDEQEFDQPPLIGGLQGQNLYEANNLFWYFTSSPWFEPMSINISVYNNVQLLPEGTQIMNDRKLWEERLRAVPQGTQFIMTGDAQGEGQPLVLQRQNKTPDNVTGEMRTHVEGNWYTQGTKVLMAPSLLDVVQSRLLTISTRMQQMAEISKDLTYWSPATGYSYFPPSYEAAKAATTASRIGSPSLAPTELDVSASQSHGQAGVAPTADTAASTTEFSDSLFMQSLNLTNRFGDEFTDENPLRGEPGAFVFENTKSAVDARNKAQEQAAQASQSASAAKPLKIDTQPPSMAPSEVETPIGLKFKTTPDKLNKKPKEKKKKPKGSISPTTPIVP